MVIEFNIPDFCRNLRISHPPPYSCPITDCDRCYKSIIGLQYHLVHYDHDNPQPLSPLMTQGRKRGRARANTLGPTTPKTTFMPLSPPKEALSYLEAQKVVQFDINDKSIRVSVDEAIPVISAEDYALLVEKGDCPFVADLPPEQFIKLPEASYNELEFYNICDAPTRSNAYIRFIEKSVEELDGEVEYDVDEEDTTWLGIINDRRSNQGVNPVSVDTLELLMDRLEKESYFQAAANGQSGSLVDDDAVCCICMDGECQNTNVILFCDMCNLAVHQDCYGVPYIPEGQWLCRRCLQSPSRAVDCVLCPNKGGAFKQTDRNQWAHVVCALWIPEVRFANTVFLEPIDSIENITPARWRLTCYICKQKNIGACIQCHRNNCYAAFHVTCAQQAGLHMRMDTVRTGNESQPITVQKTAFCDAHTPTTSLDGCKSPGDTEKARQESRDKMKMARKLLAKKRSIVPVILIPTIPYDKIQEIGGLVTMPKKAQFLQRLIAYWTLKRQYRNGVPLLRRLQSQGQSSGTARTGIEGSPDTTELYQQLKYWQCLRQDLERARLLCELVRKREKLKVVQIKTEEEIILMQLYPLKSTMVKLLDALETKDTAEIFIEPVDQTEVPDYSDVVKNPMDLSLMRTKLKTGSYITLPDLESDFELMIKNCLAYNNKDTIFYRAGVKMREYGGSIFKQARKELEQEGLVEVQKPDEFIVQEIDNELKEIGKLVPGEPMLERLRGLLERALTLKHGLSRAKRTKQIRSELMKAKKLIIVEVAKSTVTDSSQSDGESKMDTTIHQTPPCSPLKSANSSGSPSGVNRRTAVLFTRKAQAAQKKPEVLLKEELLQVDVVPEKGKIVKKSGRNKRSSNRKSIENDVVEKKKFLGRFVVFF